MTISAPSSPPPARVSIQPRMAIAIERSPFTFEPDVFEHPGQQMTMDVALPPMKRADAEAWVSLQHLTRGIKTPFLFGPPLPNRGSGAGSPVIDGAGQLRAATINTKGWTPNAQGVLKDGDYIQLGSGDTSSLHRVLATVNAGSDGKAAVIIWPFTRRNLNNEEPITTTAPKGLWRFTSTWPWDIREAEIYGVSFGLEEAL